MEESPHLSMLHTHILTLGFFFFLIVLALEKLYKLSAHVKVFRMFFWHYTIGFVMTVGAMFAIGLVQASGGESNPALNGTSGLGHILLTAGVIIFISNLNKALKAAR